MLSKWWTCTDRNHSTPSPIATPLSKRTHTLWSSNLLLHQIKGSPTIPKSLNPHHSRMSWNYSSYLSNQSISTLACPLAIVISNLRGIYCWSRLRATLRIFLVGSFRDSIKSSWTLSVINSRVYHHVNVILSKASYWEIEFIFPEKEPSYHLRFYMEPQICLHIAPYIHWTLSR